MYGTWLRRRLVKTNPDVDAAKIIRQYPEEFERSFKRASKLARKEKKLKAGGPGSGRHKETYDVQLVGREKAAQDLLEKLGYNKTSEETNGKKVISLQHPNGHSAEIVRNKNYTWQVKLNGPDEHHQELKDLKEGDYKLLKPVGANKGLSDIDRYYKSVSKGPKGKFYASKVKKLKYKEKSQTDEAGFTGKPFRTQDTKYGHLINEFDSSEEAFKSSLARPYTRVLHHREPTQTASFRNKTRKKVVSHNPDNPDSV